MKSPFCQAQDAKRTCVSNTSLCEDERVEQAIARRHAFEALCEEYVDLSCQLAAMAKEGEISEGALRKEPSSPSSRTRK